MDTLWENLPRDILHTVLRYNRRIKFKDGKYFDINKIAESDNRYNVILPVILKKIDLIDLSENEPNNFYLEVEFDTITRSGLSYYFSDDRGIEIRYFNERDEFEI